jgi:chromosome segregation ATPase
LRDAAESQARIQELTAEVAKLKEHLAEMADSLRAATEDNESMERIILADDRLTALMDEVKRFKEQARVSMARVRGITSELNDAKHYARLWKKKFDALEKKMKGKADDAPDGGVS